MFNRTTSLIIILSTLLAGISGILVGNYTTNFLNKENENEIMKSSEYANNIIDENTSKIMEEKLTSLSNSDVPTNSESGIIVVTGFGSVKVSPDRVILNLAIVTEEKDVNKASKENSRIFSTMLDKIHILNINRDMIETSSYYINPIYNYDNGNPVIIGYRVEHSFKIIVQEEDVDILGDRAGQIIDSATKIGVNRINGIQFTISPDEISNLKNEALRKAIQDANKKASLMASELNVELRSVQVISENVYSPTQMSNRNYRLEDMSAAATEFIPGSSTISAQVQISYIIN